MFGYSDVTPMAQETPQTQIELTTIWWNNIICVTTISIQTTFFLRLQGHTISVSVWTQIVPIPNANGQYFLIK